MAHPALQCPDVNAVPQMLCCESVTELVEKEMPAVRPLGAFVSLFGDALSAVQFGALGDALDDHVVFTVGIPFLNSERLVVKVTRVSVLGVLAAALQER